MQPESSNLGQPVVLSDLDGTLRHNGLVQLVVGMQLGLRMRLTRSAMINVARAVISQDRDAIITQLQMANATGLAGYTEAEARDFYHHALQWSHRFGNVWHPGALELMQTCMQNDWQFTVMSGSHDVQIRSSLARADVDGIHVEGTQYGFDGQRFTGTVERQLDFGHQKAALLPDEGTQVVMALGDSIHDLPLLQRVDPGGLRVVVGKRRQLMRALLENGYNVQTVSNGHGQIGNQPHDVICLPDNSLAPLLPVLQRLR